MWIVVNGPGGLDETMVLGDHIEIDHEREMPGYWTFEELNRAHRVIHQMRNDCGHFH